MTTSTHNGFIILIYWTTMGGMEFGEALGPFETEEAAVRAAEADESRLDAGREELGWSWQVMKLGPGRAVAE